MIGSRPADLIEADGGAVETEWMAAAETRMPIATKALAEREASMDGWESLGKADKRTINCTAACPT